MDFADDFTYFTFEQVLEEARRLYSHNKHIVDIELRGAANDEPKLRFTINKPNKLTVSQLGLPGSFRCLKTEFVAANA